MYVVDMEGRCSQRRCRVARFQADFLFQWAAYRRIWFPCLYSKGLGIICSLFDRIFYCKGLAVEGILIQDYSELSIAIKTGGYQRRRMEYSLLVDRVLIYAPYY